MVFAVSPVTGFSLPAPSFPSKHIIVGVDGAVGKEWEKLAGGVKGTYKIAYWDTEHSGRPPFLLGEIQGTPTIRFFKPKPKQEPGKVNQKLVLDYNQDRTAVALKRFGDYYMPNFVESIKDNTQLDAFQEKALRNVLPKVILFTSKDKPTMPLPKYLSTEFRRRLLLGEIKPSARNHDKLLEQFGISKDMLPALVVLPLVQGAIDDDLMSVTYGDPVIFPGSGSGGDFTKNKLTTFLSKYALKNIVPYKPRDKGSSKYAAGPDGKGEEEDEKGQRAAKKQKEKATSTKEGEL